MSKKLAADLREIAFQWEQSPGESMFLNGICFALAELRDSRSVDGANRQKAYNEVQSLLRKIEPTFTRDSTYLPCAAEDENRKDWEPRANMCLLMAHWLEDQA